MCSSLSFSELPVDTSCSVRFFLSEMGQPRSVCVATSVLRASPLVVATRHHHHAPLLHLQEHHFFSTKTASLLSSVPLLVRFPPSPWPNPPEFLTCLR